VLYRSLIVCSVFLTHVSLQFAISAPPGHVTCPKGDIVLNVGREITHLTVTNMADRPIQVAIC
jgi:hypothetical protein